jgi:hypothetical protein
LKKGTLKIRGAAEYIEETEEKSNPSKLASIYKRLNQRR